MITMMSNLHTKKEEDAMSNKSVKKVLAVALLSTMGLIACGNKVQAKPSNYDEPLITFTEDGDKVYNNLVSIIDDAYRDGTLASAVLDKILYVYATSVFGTYNRVVTPEADAKEVTLKEAAKDVNDHENLSEAKKAKEFLDKHKAYWSLDNEGKRKTDADSADAEFRRITAKWQTIEDRISRKLFSDISGGSYNDEKGYFSEIKYLKDLRGNLYKVADAYNKELHLDDIAYTEENKKIVTSALVDEENVWVRGTGDEEQGYLHRDLYQTNGDLNQVETKSEDNNSYVEDEIIPTIYRELLVEQYLVEESYNNLGRSSARKINVLAISDNANSDTAANYLMKYFVREKISKGEEITLADFREVSNAMKGLLDETTHKNAFLEEMMNEVKYPEYAGAFTYKTFEGYDDQNYAYYNGTDFGDMMKNFEKIKKDINLTDSAVESDFTNSYTYDAKIGYEKKTNEIQTKDYTVDGWYAESSGLGDLPDAIKTRLFNIGVANVLDNEEIEDRITKTTVGEDTTVTYSDKADSSKLVTKINGKYYLKVASKEAEADPRDDILFKVDGKYYIVQIVEAVSGSKLAKDSKIYEKDSENPDRKQEIINEVARVVASKDTYQTLSTKHWLKQAAIKYHDTKVYDYFKENYPDLFD